MNIKIKGNLKMYEISEQYKQFLRKSDIKVSMKDNRKFYGIIINANNIDYYIPFTSKITKKTNKKLTVEILHKNNVIAKLLLNNMIPVNIEDAKIVDINKSNHKEYYQNELRYLRSEDVKNEILVKIENIFNVLEDSTHKDYSFFKKLCCDFKLLEKKCKEYYGKNNI